jgi:hypothetical protein
MSKKEHLRTFTTRSIALAHTRFQGRHVAQKKKKKKKKKKTKKTVDGEKATKIRGRHNNVHNKMHTNNTEKKNLNSSYVCLILCVVHTQKKKKKAKKKKKNECEQ